MNPGGFDYEAWLFRQGLRATGYVADAPGNRRLAAGGGIHWWRHAVRDRIHAVLPDARFRPLLVALAIGDQSAIPAGAWDVLNRTGTNHLLAISGLHVGLVAAIAFVITRFVWVRSGAAALCMPAPYAGRSRHASPRPRMPRWPDSRCRPSAR